MSLAEEVAIERDIGRKCSDDVSDVMARNLSLLTGAKSKFVVATFGASVAIAWASAALIEMLGPDATPEQCLDALNEKLRPMVLRGIADAQAKRALGEGSE